MPLPSCLCPLSTGQLAPVLLVSCTQRPKAMGRVRKMLWCSRECWHTWAPWQEVSRACASWPAACAGRS